MSENKKEYLTATEKERAIRCILSCDRLFDNGDGLSDKALAYHYMRLLTLELYDKLIK